MRLNKFTRLTLVMTIIFIATAIHAQEYNHLGYIPADAKSGTYKFTGMAVNSEGAVYFLDDLSKSVIVFNESGALAEKIKTIQTASGPYTLSNPKSICLDANNNLYIYDQDPGRIIRRPVKGEALVYGSKGSTLGQINNVYSIAADSKGYCYVLNGATKRVDVLAPDGSFLTWINGGGSGFEDPVALGVNGADELYVLDETGPTVRMFDVFGALVNTNRSLANRKNVRLTKAISMAVLSNGDFLVLDGETCQVTHFNRVGVMLGVLGAKADKTDKGTFVQASLISGSTGAPDKISILDKTTQQAQLFSVDKVTKPLTEIPQRYKMVLAGSRRKPAYDLAAAPSGNRYVIPYDDRKKVIAYKDTSELDVFTVQGKLEDAVCVVSDTASNLYIVDRGAKEIFVFDPEGTLIRKLGKDVKDKLRDPVSMVIQKSGNIVVADKGRSSLYMWSSLGVFKKIITSPENSVIKSPAKIQRDSKDQLYVWDDDANCIYRVGSGGWPTSEKKLFARSEKAGDTPGKIVDFFIDPTDNIHIYNKTTGQIEVYAWEFDPVIRYSMGYLGSKPDAFDNVEKMVLDENTMHIYFTEKKGLNQKVYQFLIPPPIPANSVNYDVVDGKLQVFFSKSNSKSVVAYGLMTPTASGDSIAYRTTESFFTIEQNPADDQLRHYDFVSLSLSDHSDPSIGFDDYFSYGESMIHAKRYDEALGAWQIALEKTGRPMRMAQHIAGRLSTVAIDLARNYDIPTALEYVKAAYALDQKSPAVLASYSSVYKAAYQQHANRNDIQGIVADAESHHKNPVLKEITMQAIDSVSQILALEENLKSINSAIVLQKKLVEWDKFNPGYAGSLAASYYELYKFKSVRETSAPELNSILDEVRTNGRTAYLGLKNQNKNYFESHLTLLAAMNETGKFKDVETQAAAELGGSAAQMSQSIAIRYRIELARAFLGLKQTSEAVAEYKTILRLAPEDRQASLLLADALIEEKNYDAAKNVLQQLMLGNNDNSEIIARIGQLELMMGNYNEAIFQLEKALTQSPSLRAYYGPLAEAYDKSSNFTKAVDYYEVAIAYLREMARKTGQRNTFSTQQTDIPKRLESYLLATGKVNESLGDLSAARTMYAEATAINPQNADGWFRLGNACRGTNRTYDAIEAYNNALSLDENNKTYINAYVNAVGARENALKNETPLSILDIQVKNVFPSLYKNYADVRQLPLGELIIANNTPDEIATTSITVFVPDLMSQPTSVNSPVISGYSNAAVKLAAIFPENIMQVNESQTRQLTVEVQYMSNGKPQKITKTAQFTLNNRNAIVWTDKRRLASFVTPNHEKLVEYNKKSDAMFRNAPTYGQNKNMLKAMQLYTLLNKSGLSYSNDPAQSYSKLSLHSDMIDYLQYPLETMKRKGGDCDDLVALYASMLENGGISAAYIDLPGHVMAAFDLKINPDQLSEAGLSPSEVIVIGDRVWVPVEATLIGTKNFFTAWKSAAERFYRDLNAGNYPDLIPFGDAWSIYQPSNFTPEGADAEPPSSKDVLDNYDVLLTQLVAKTKREAISEISARYNLEPENSYVLNLYGTLLAQTGETVKARKIFEDALLVSPDNASVLNNLGNVYLLERNYEKAAYYYEQASQMDGRDANILINLCRTYLSQGDKVKAKEALNKAFELDPELPEIYTDLKTQLK